MLIKISVKEIYFWDNYFFLTVIVHKRISFKMDFGSFRRIVLSEDCDTIGLD